MFQNAAAIYGQSVAKRQKCKCLFAAEHWKEYLWYFAQIYWSWALIFWKQHNIVTFGNNIVTFQRISVLQHICDALCRFTEACYGGSADSLSIIFEYFWKQHNIVTLETILCRIFVMFCADLQKPAMAAPQIRFQ